MLALLGLVLFEASAVLAAPNWDLVAHGVVEDFKWERPWPDDGTPLRFFEIPCQAEAVFHAKQYTIADLYEQQPNGLAPWAEDMNFLLHSRAYPGSWDGTAMKGDHREILLFDWDKVPSDARSWIEKELADEEGSHKRFFGVYPKPKVAASAGSPGQSPIIKDEDKVLLIAPGELYEFLPLWLAEKSQCRDKFTNLSLYIRAARDVCVVAWVTEHPSHKKTDEDRAHGKHDVEFKIEARYAEELEEGKAHREFWEKAQRNLERNQRKLVREERAAQRQVIHEERKMHDEL